ncbi:MAG: DUF2971 domain-containing protein [Alphaproteobacteria bacterium]|nr:DUF2971 domain-containing protein [Alphaproteobacteria bacterium]
MNDPMEAFYEVGGPADHIIDTWLQQSSMRTADLYETLAKAIESFALISFSSAHEDFPMWAYYASNFAGMCLEFDAGRLLIGELQNEQLLQVNYARNPLPPVTLSDFASTRLPKAITSRISRKRIEWSHEKEWRYVTGNSGKKHYLDDALRRVFLGPRISQANADKICQALDRRNTEVLVAKVDGFKMLFHSIKPARPLEECDRVGAGAFKVGEDFPVDDEIKRFLNVPIADCIALCRQMALQPNMEKFFGIDLNIRGDALYIWTEYKLRNNNHVFNRRYFDKNLRVISPES